MMSAAALLRWQFRLVHALRSTDLARHAAMTVCEDITINSVLQRGMPLALSGWRARTGLSELPPLARPDRRLEWMRRLRIDSTAFNAYARAVHAATDVYLDGLVEEPPEGVTQVLVALILKLTQLRGEIDTSWVGAQSRLQHEHHYQRGKQANQLRQARHGRAKHHS